MAAVLGFPLVRVVVLSFQDWGLAQIFTDRAPEFAAGRNYRRIVTDRAFWSALRRTVVLTVAMVALSMAAGVSIALLMERVPAWIRRAVTFVLVLAWAVPSFVSTQVFAWMTDQNAGVLNSLLGLGRHNWYIDSAQGLSVTTAIVVWGAVPFIAITTYAALTQVPAEIVEAARVDGATGWQVLRRITLPVIRPVLVILTALSVIWDFQVFNQIWILRNAAPAPGYQTLSIYSYVKAYQGHEYGYASAVAVVTVLLLLVVMVFYLRRIVRAGEGS
ncbi:carbohydrate ABC transporter permease [Bailinhaonella thermotolerans]|uniref:Sugar ABC transporter permease n=1 Tax=Bailinhaonella thermotolerans TaxID=1070861 RepID=A0A3A4A761_9ACTN|nr:sugar ABC transporter permease [Bailinhaonella thermotolerans]RJL24415.1 sugar ABC transporter permease [Bailinhaonella thermotolerans]